MTPCWCDEPCDRNPCPTRDHWLHVEDSEMDASLPPRICSAGTGGGEVCYRRKGHDGPHDSESTEVYP